MTTTEPKPRSLLWPGMVFMFLGLSAVVMGITLYFALSDPTVAVEHDYYRRGLAWDDEAAARRRFDELGWSLALRAPTEDSKRHALVLTSSIDQPLEGASVSVNAFHDAHARDAIHAPCPPVEPGVYTIPGELTPPGHWTFRVTIRRGPETVCHEFGADVEPSP